MALSGRAPSCSLHVQLCSVVFAFSRLQCTEYNVNGLVQTNTFYPAIRPSTKIFGVYLDDGHTIQTLSTRDSQRTRSAV